MSNEYMQVYPLQGETIHDTDKGKFRVTVERIEPEPEKKWWYCRWTDDEGFSADGQHNPYPKERVHASWVSDGSVAYAACYLCSASEPTLAEFAAAVKDATGVGIPEPEEPNRWRWDRRKEVWEAGAAIGLLHDGIINEREVLVTGIAADRDAKRDALLEAARKAGKP